VTADGAILVTGAAGFVGRILCDALAARGRNPRRAVRTPDPACPDAVAVGDIGSGSGWHAALEGVRDVVHLAARTHVLRETAPDALAEYRRVNVAGTERVARAAAARGVRRLVFASSVKVNGESTGARPYTEDDAPRPEDPYGISKWEAEQALARVASETGLEVVVLRPPLVYGPGVRANFLRLMRLVASGLPLPFRSIRNRRSFLYLGNLVALLRRCAEHPRAAGKTLLAADGEDLSTPELTRRLGAALGRVPLLVPFPVALLPSRLAGSLLVDAAETRDVLDWRPPYGVDEGLARTAAWYRG